MPAWDLANADCVLVMGSNMAEAHPVAFRFVMQAKKRGATVIHVDPRFTRTSAMADIYAPIRAGSDIAFLGGLIRYILENDLIFKDFALAYTNLSTIIDPEFKDDTENGGLFSGWDEESQSYKTDSWQYEDFVIPSALSEHYLDTAENSGEHASREQRRPPKRDETLQHPNCVYQILKRHYAAYTPEIVEKVTGCPAKTFLKIAEAITKNSGRERTASICYAVGWNHHSVGAQIIRTGAIVQMLLGNIGRPGGGIVALRGHASIQGSTDIPTLYNMLPSYLPQPHAFQPQQTLKDYLKIEQLPTGFWNNFPKFIVSLLRAWYGPAATKENEWGYGWIPKIVGDHSQQAMTLSMKDGLMRGLFLLGQNVVIGGSNSKMIQDGLANLEWLVVRDISEIESASFWYQGHAIQEGRKRPEDIGTEIFLMPAALSGEKGGTFTNTHRLVQWHDHVVDAPGDSRSELWFIYHLGKRLQQLYADSDDPKDEPIRHLYLDYPVEGERNEPSPEAVLREINGYTWNDRKQLAKVDELKDDGSTACGAWLYVGAYPKNDHNQTRCRKPDAPDGPGTHLNWAFAWPSNRRTLYNRASADPDGKPWSERKKLIWWDADKKKWQSDDEIDFEPDKPPQYEPDWKSAPKGMDAIGGADPFILMPDGRAHVFVPSGMKEGPLPSHFEPVESPVPNLLSPLQNSPTVKRWERKDNPEHETGDPRYPYVLTTYRLTEHHTGGAPTRLVPSTSELQPQGFAELSPELARKLGILPLDWVVLSTERGEIETKAIITERLRPFEISGKRIHQIGIPWHFGWEGHATGGIANVLTATIGDANTSMQVSKSFTCDLRKGRLKGEVAA